jgi:hypothetical protein
MLPNFDPRHETRDNVRNRFSKTFPHIDKASKDRVAIVAI